MLPKPIETVCMAFRTDCLDKLLFVPADTRSTISVTSLPLFSQRRMWRINFSNRTGSGKRVRVNDLRICPTFTMSTKGEHTPVLIKWPPTNALSLKNFLCIMYWYRRRTSLSLSKSVDGILMRLTFRKTFVLYEPFFSFDIEYLPEGP